MARGSAFLRDKVEDVVFVDLRFPDGRLAHVHVSWLDPHKIRKFTVVGSQQMAVFDDMEASEKIRIYDKGAAIKHDINTSYTDIISLRFGDIVIPKTLNGEPLSLECQHFIDCVQNGEQPKSDGWDGLRVVKVLQAAQESLRQGGIPVCLENVS